MVMTTKPATKSASKTTKTTKPKRVNHAEQAALASKTTQTTTLRRKPAARATAQTQVSPELRQHYIEVAAYYLAEQRGFAGASTLDDWVQAECQIDQLLRESQFTS